ncbi:FAD:protein FMN transferase [uncultured Pseudodesulfovibrio sp.]|uniref:FAD:protein FMN transferase n=1 Tax=uncultured Pseudodesulfovibrio sp. TaxID=2035858 RepID=UPI0029C6B57B|nr:FAD:protein FMN transferase [uncultured Pseudodesulfovibrio sp.]
MKNSYSRRAFLRTLGLIGLGASIPAPALAAVKMADVTRLTGNRVKVSETRFLMGTFVAITAIHESRTLAEHGVGLAFEEIERLSAIFDRHRDNTPVSRLNDEGRLGDITPELHNMMREALAYTELTVGAYDPTVLPVVEMLRDKAAPTGRMDISEAELKEALALVDAKAIHVSGNEIRFDKQGMGITLDGMGKGYIVDRASDVLNKAGVANHMINAGGDMRARGERTPGKPWTVAIEDPAGKGKYPALIELRNAAIATSGGYEASYNASGSRHHVIDPRTALSPTRSVSVSVVAPTVMQADALSTAAFVMHPKDGVRFINTLPQCETLIIGDSGVKLTSRHWKQC